jgi:tripartite-type tricarboxylate transporter receptor subunit TctC
MKIPRLIWLLAITLSTAVHAQSWPSKPIKLIIPYAAGSGPDVATRPVAEQIGRILKQPVIVENLASAGGIVGTRTVARAAPDGYTFGFGNNITLAVNTSFYRSLPYDPIKDFSPVGLLFDNPYILVARKDFKPNSIAEFIAYVKQNPGKVNFASGTGVGSGSHLTGEMMKAVGALEITHVPYRSGSMALSDVVSGRVDVMFDNVNGVQQFISNGTLKAFAVTSSKRLATMPDVPTMAESGFPNFEAVAWGGIVAPKGTPDAIVGRMNEAIGLALKTPQVDQANAAMSLNPISSTPEEFAAFIAAETKRWAETVKVSGARAE